MSKRKPKVFRCLCEFLQHYFPKDWEKLLADYYAKRMK